MKSANINNGDCPKLLVILFIVVVQFIEPIPIFAETQITSEQLEMFESEKSETRAKAVEEITKSDDKTAVSYLIEALKDKEKIVVKKAIIGLGEIGDSKALKPLMGWTLRFDDLELHKLAMRSVEKITNRIQSSKTDSFFTEEKKVTSDNFIRISSGYLKENLATLNSLIADITSSSETSAKERKFTGDSIPIRFDFGFRFGSSVGIGGIGYIPNQTINLKYSSGAIGKMTLDSYFTEFNYKHYLIGIPDDADLSKKIFPYLSVGLGYYFMSWKIDDSNIIADQYNPEYGGSGIGLNVSGGGEFFIYQKLSLDFRAGYLYARILEIGYSSPIGRFILVDSSMKPIDVDLSGFFILVGINLYIL